MIAQELLKIFIFHILFFLFTLFKVYSESRYEQNYYPEIIQIVYFLIFAAGVIFSKFFLFNYHKFFNRHSKLSFYLGSCFFYLSIYILVVLILSEQKNENSRAYQHYFSFLFLLIFVNMFDYSLFSYKRYQKLLERGAW